MADTVAEMLKVSPHHKMVAQVREEAAHLPGPAPAWYGQLRRLYWLRRMESLGRKSHSSADPMLILSRCLYELGHEWGELPGDTREWFDSFVMGEQG